MGPFDSESVHACGCAPSLSRRNGSRLLLDLLLVLKGIVALSLIRRSILLLNLHKRLASGLCLSGLNSCVNLKSGSDQHTVSRMNRQRLLLCRLFHLLLFFRARCDCTSYLGGLIR